MAWLAVNKSAGGGSPIRTENPGPLVTSRYRRGGARCSAAAGKTITRLRQSRCAGWLRLRALPWRGSGGPRQRTSPLVTSTTSRSTPPAAAASEVFFFFYPTLLDRLWLQLCKVSSRYRSWYRNFLHAAARAQRATRSAAAACGPAADWHGTAGTGRPDRRSALTGSEQEGKPERDTRMDRRRRECGEGRGVPGTSAGGSGGMAAQCWRPAAWAGGELDPPACFSFASRRYHHVCLACFHSSFLVSSSGITSVIVIQYTYTNVKWRSTVQNFHFRAVPPPSNLIFRSMARG